MSKIFLHHYAGSPFSEKIRAVLGYLGLEWQSVIIPVIMPKPLLMPLTGGYRKTPVLQIGANVYCDTKIIVPTLARYAKDRTLFAGGFAAHRVADWADSQLFRIAVTLIFRPEAAVAAFKDGTIGGVSIADFMKDRAELSAGASLATSTPAAAEGNVLHVLTELDATLAEQKFVCGDTPTVADFSVYHCLWFLMGSPLNAPYVQSRPNVMAWFQRIRDFGQGKEKASTGEEALAAARAAEPEMPPQVVIGSNLKLGAKVKVMPQDYGKVPVGGELVCADAEQIALRRHSEETGTVIAHFPRPGFDIEVSA
jgi:glutathione S-transferase